MMRWTMWLVRSWLVLVTLASPSVLAQQVTGLAIIPTSKGKIAFIARNGQLLGAELGDRAQEVGEESFARAKASVGYAFALATYGSQLLVSDPAGAAVHLYDPVSGSATRFLELRPQSHPAKMAASDSGDIAIFDANNQQLVIFTPETKAKGEKVPTRHLIREIPVSDVSSIAFGGSTLLVCRENAIYAFDTSRARKIDLSSEPDLRLLTRLPSGITAEDLAAARGTTYIVHREGVMVLTQPDHKVLPIAALPEDRSGRLLSADANVLATYGETERRLRVLPRDAVPVVFTIEGNLEAGVNAVYEYLATTSNSSVVRIAPDRRHARLVDWLVEVDLVPRETAESGIGTSAVAKQVCKHNPGMCLPREEEILARSIGPDTTVRYPRMPSEVSSIVRKRAISTSLGEYIDTLPKRYQPSHQVLTRLNVDALETLDSTLTLSQMLLTGPQSSALRAGDIVVFNGGREERIASLKTCATFQVSVGPPPIPIPHVATTAAGLEAIPVDTYGFSKRRDAVKRVKLEYRAPMVEALELRVGEFNQAAECFSRLTANIGRPVALVTHVLRATSARATLLDAKGEPLRLASEELRLVSLNPSNDGAPGAFEIDYPFTAAFTPGRPTETQPVRFEVPADFVRLKSHLPQNPLNLAPGTYTVPTFVWRIWSLVPRNHLEGKGSPLDQLKVAQRGVFVLPQDNLGLRPQNATPDVKSPQKNRAALMEANGYKPWLRSSADRVVLGIIEHKDHVEADHDAFIENGTSAWVTYSNDDFIRKPVQPRGRSLAVRESIGINKDHGTHVGAIISSVDKDVPGLLPAVRLYNIDAAAGLTQVDSSIEEVAASIRIFNFSQAAPSDGSIDSLRDKIERVWSPFALFVVAAGNAEKEGGVRGINLDRTAGVKLALIGWVPSARQNMIGVAATDFSGRIIEECDVDPGRNEKLGCSNYGKLHVQIAAPGYHILSAGHSFDYVVGSGTSMATPQVTATAAMILQRAARATPAQLKARLIYTSDFDSNYIGKIWGGKLNVARAVLGVDADIDTAMVRTLDTPPKTYRVRFKRDGRLKFRGGSLYDPLLENGGRPLTSLALDKILRLQLDNVSNKLWLVYTQPDTTYQMRIAYDVLPDGIQKIPVTSVELLDDSKGTFKAELNHTWLTGGISVSDLRDFVGPLPVYVNF